jgi:general secretion pathway protein D
MIIGGLVQAGTTENEGGLPGLSKIPLVGRTIFGNTAKTKTKTTLLIFCTARIIPPEKTPQVYGDRMQWDAMKRSDSETIKTRLTPTRSSKTNTPSVPDKINQR